MGQSQNPLMNSPRNPNVENDRISEIIQHQLSLESKINGVQDKLIDQIEILQLQIQRKSIEPEKETYITDVSPNSFDRKSSP